MKVLLRRPGGLWEVARYEGARRGGELGMSHEEAGSEVL
jgi:hypothetical protein